MERTWHELQLRRHERLARPPPHRISQRPAISIVRIRQVVILFLGLIQHVCRWAGVRKAAVMSGTEFVGHGNKRFTIPDHPENQINSD